MDFLLLLLSGETSPDSSCISLFFLSLLLGSAWAGTRRRRVIYRGTRKESWEREVTRMPGDIPRSSTVAFNEKCQPVTLQPRSPRLATCLPQQDFPVWRAETTKRCLRALETCMRGGSYFARSSDKWVDLFRWCSAYYAEKKFHETSLGWENWSWKLQGNDTKLRRIKLKGSARFSDFHD